MTVLSKVAAAALPLCIVFLICGFAADTPRVPDLPFIATSAPAYDPLAMLSSGERFPKGSQLLLVQHGKETSLVQGFAATADASISYDGKRVLFSGRQSAADPWAIWEVTLEGRSVRKVMGADADLIRPLYLPEDRFVFAQKTSRGFQVMAAQMDGTAAVRLTFTGAAAVPQTVLADGRILFESTFPLGKSIEEGATPELYLMYSDGSGVESYRCDHGTARWGGTQLASGDLVFTHGATLARFTSPFATEKQVVAPHADFDGSIAELPSGAWLLSARSAASTHYGLRLWKPGQPLLAKLLDRKDEDLVEPEVVAAHERPHRHPSALHDWDYGNLLALDARVSREGSLHAVPAKIRLESQDEKGNVASLGTAPVEPDGSFFLKAPADKPIRFALLDDKDATIRSEHGWFWIRKGEQRYCVGCHAGPEHAPENRVPQVLLRTTIPADLAGAGHQATPGGH